MGVVDRGASRRMVACSWKLLVPLLVLALASLAAINASTSRAAFPGQDGRIFFLSDRDGNAEIYSMNSDGTDQRRLTNTSHDEVSPSASPNGRWVVFSSNAEGTGNERVEIMRSNGSAKRVLTGGTGDPSYSPSFRPDGRAVLYINGLGGGASEIWEISLSSGNRVLIASTSSPLIAPSRAEYLPDGSRIIYRALDGPIGLGTDRIFSIPPGDPFSPQQISFDSGIYNGIPSVSPDSRSVIYTTFGGGNSKLIETDLASLTSLTVYSESDPFFVNMGVYSPSGSRVAYERESVGEISPFQIHAKSADNTDAGPVLTGPGSNNAGPNWAPRTLTARFRTSAKPPARTARRTAKFRFRAVTRGTRLTCQLDRRPVRQCPVGRTVTFKRLKPGPHRLRVTPYLVDQTARALGEASRVDSRAVSLRWKVR